MYERKNLLLNSEIRFLFTKGMAKAIYLPYNESLITIKRLMHQQLGIVGWECVALGIVVFNFKLSL